MIISHRRNDNGILPLAVFCCLGFLLFTIAFTIVIALIPVYLPRRNGGQAQPIQGPLRQVTYSIPPGTTYPNGPLSQAQLAYLITHVIKTV
jgi:hypothetical protein